MKRGLIFSLLLILSLSLVSAGFFSNFWGKLTGNVVSQPTSLYVINSDSSSITWKWNSVSGDTSYYYGLYNDSICSEIGRAHV